MEAIVDLFRGIDRMAPGSQGTTAQAFRIAASGRELRRIVEFGCGAGISTIALAQLTSANITAIDTCGPFLQRLDTKAAVEGMAERIEVREQSMDADWPEGAHFDAVWCEGAVYCIGLENALPRWRRLLMPGGVLAVSDLVWLTESPAAEIEAYWQAQGVKLRHRDMAESLFAEHSYRLVESFVYPESDWQNYYGPVHQRLAQWVPQYADRQEADQVAAAFQEEMEMTTRFAHQVGYVFFIAEAV